MKQIQKYIYWPICGLAEIYLYADESYLALLFVGILMTTLAGLLDKSCDLRGEIIEICCVTGSKSITLKRKTQ